MPTFDRMKDKHNDYVKQLAKVSAKRDKLITSLVRVEFQRVALIRAVARSSKRLDKARSVAALNAPLPSTEPLDLGALSPEQADKVIASAPLPTHDLEPKPVRAIPYSEAHPHSKWAKATKRPRGHADLTDFANTFPKAVRESLEDSRKAEPKPIPAKEAKQLSALNRQLSDALLGKEVAAANDRIARKRKPRRTPDDFKADIEKRSATDGSR
jgi:hypothetical protein